MMGQLTGAHGVKGWVKVFSFTDPPANILGYKQWQLRYPDGRCRSVNLVDGRPQGKGLAASIEGVQDREAAQLMAGACVFVPRASLPGLDEGEYYWHQLQGLRVRAFSLEGATQDSVLLGRVHHLMATGANDVLVVRDEEGDGREYLIPWLDHVVVAVDLEQREVQVRWDVDF